MPVISWNWNPRRSSLRLAIVAFALTVCTSLAFAQGPQAPYSLFERATLTGSGNTITAVNVPIVVSQGLTVYANVTMQFSVDQNGNLTLMAGYPQVFPAPIVLSASFKAGRYIGPGNFANGKGAITVSGPGVTDGGATTWSSSAAVGANACTYPSSATWYTGPISSSPMAARVEDAGISSTAWSYGVAGPAVNWACGGSPGTYWETGTLIGVSQTGNAVTFASFSRNGYDQSEPVAQITYTLAP